MRLRLLSLLAAVSAFVLAAAARADSVWWAAVCFWCMDAAYKLLPGVTHITCGYAGAPWPTRATRMSAPRRPATRRW